MSVDSSAHTHPGRRVTHGSGLGSGSLGGSGGCRSGPGIHLSSQDARSDVLRGRGAIVPPVGCPTPCDRRAHPGFLRVFGRRFPSRCTFRVASIGLPIIDPPRIIASNVAPGARAPDRYG